MNKDDQAQNDSFDEISLDELPCMGDVWDEAPAVKKEETQKKEEANDAEIEIDDLPGVGDVWDEPKKEQKPKQEAKAHAEEKNGEDKANTKPKHEKVFKAKGTVVEGEVKEGEEKKEGQPEKKKNNRKNKKNTEENGTGEHENKEEKKEEAPQLSKEERAKLAEQKKKEEAKKKIEKHQKYLDKLPKQYTPFRPMKTFNSKYQEFNFGEWKRRSQYPQIHVTPETIVPDKPKKLLSEPDDVAYHMKIVEMDEEIELLNKEIKDIDS